jgi:hypothetical protein
VIEYRYYTNPTRLVQSRSKETGKNGRKMENAKQYAELDSDKRER